MKVSVSGYESLLYVQGGIYWTCILVVPWWFCSFHSWLQIILAPYALSTHPNDLVLCLLMKDSVSAYKSLVYVEGGIYWTGILVVPWWFCSFHSWLQIILAPCHHPADGLNWFRG